MASVEEVAKAIAAVKQGSGLVGKLSTVACFAFGAMGLGLYSMPGEPWKVGAMLVGIAMVAGVFLLFVSWMLKYAKENPLHASLESSDLVEMKKLEVASKDQGVVVPTANTEAPIVIEKKPE
jgi:hypothetical protein